VIGVSITVQLNHDEQLALQERAVAQGISVDDAARQAILEYVERGRHAERVGEAADLVIAAHADAIDRLGR
jgi:predicted nucleic acid-binding protein